MKKNYRDKTLVLNRVEDCDQFIIPQFQRNVVWKKPRRKEFLRNVRAGEPFGIILVREKEEGKYELIDGLQRISTIRDYFYNRYEYLGPEDVDADSVKKIIINNLKAQDIEATDDYISNSIDQYKEKLFECVKGGLKNYETIDVFIKEFSLVDAKEVKDSIDEAYTAFITSTELEGLTIPAINYIGPEENIPDVFYNLNTGGVQLTKYETYAALWSSPKYMIQSEDILSAIKDKYEMLKNNSNLDVDFAEDSLLEDGITLFEYCYSISSILRDKQKKMDMIFGENEKSTDPIGFEILALLLTGKVNKANEIYTKLKDSSPEFLIKLKDVIKASSIDVANALRGLLEGMNGAYLYSDNSYLIYHMLVSYILEYYHIDIEGQTIQKKQSPLTENDFSKYAPLHYLKDCMQDYWKKNRQVSDLEREINATSRRQKYWHKISKEEWIETVSVFMESQSGVAKTIPQRNKLFIDYITKMRIKENPQYNKYFTTAGFSDESYDLDFEHITPKKRIEKHIGDLSSGEQKRFPISVVGNLCYLTSKDNRSKRDKTLYEFVDDRPAYVTEEMYRKCIMYPDKEELDFLDYNNNDFRAKYSEFIKNRNNWLANEFLRLVD